MTTRSKILLVLGAAALLAPATARAAPPTPVERAEARALAEGVPRETVVAVRRAGAGHPPGQVAAALSALTALTRAGMGPEEGAAAVERALSGNLQAAEIARAARSIIRAGGQGRPAGRWFAAGRGNGPGSGPARPGRPFNGGTRPNRPGSGHRPTPPRGNGHR